MLLYTYQTNGPSSVSTISHRNNGLTTVQMGMPFKPQNMAQGSLFSNNRKTFVKDAGGGKNWYSSSDVVAMKRINAIGKSSTKTGLAANAPLTYKSYDNNYKNTRLQRTRSGGCVAPKKKGAIANTFKSGGRTTYGNYGPVVY